MRKTIFAGLALVGIVCLLVFVPKNTPQPRKNIPVPLEYVVSPFDKVTDAVTFGKVIGVDGDVVELENPKMGKFYAQFTKTQFLNIGDVVAFRGFYTKNGYIKCELVKKGASIDGLVNEVYKK